MAQIVNVTDTFSFWREQFNALVGEVGAKRYFKTPQDFGAVGDPAVNDTAAFDLAQNQPFPVYIPPGVYNITKNYTGANKFFDFGGVTYVGGGSVVPGFSLNATGNLQLNKNIFGLDPINPQHLSTKNYVDEQVSSEASARASADAALQAHIDLTPNSSNWYNNGILRVKADGGTELGQYVDFHSTSTSGDFDARILATNYLDNKILSFGCISKTASHVMDLYAGNFRIDDKIGPGSWTLILSSEHLTSVDSLFGVTDNSYLVCSLIDNYGGARLRGHYHNGINRNAPALLLEGVKNDNGQVDSEFSVVTAQAFSLLPGGVGTGCNVNDNIFGVYNNSSIRMVVKGDGRVIAPNCSIEMIQGSATNKILTTKEYVDNYTYTKSESDSRFVNVTGDTMTGNLVIGRDRPIISLNNLQPGYNTNFGLHVASNNFYILKNDPAIINSENGWDPIYPLELRTSNNQGYIFGDMVLHEGNMEYFSVDHRKISQGTWWNEGFLRVKGDGVTELGKAIDFHYDANATSNDWNYRIEAYYIPAFASYGLKFNNNYVTSLDIRGNHVHAPNTSVSDYDDPDSGRMLTTKEYVDHILDGNIIDVTDEYDENVPKIVRKTGWRKINGTIIQWGSVISQDLRTVTFPVAFDNACTSVQITRNHRKVWTYGNEVYTSGITKTKFDFEISGHNGSWQNSHECTWIAIGY